MFWIIYFYASLKRMAIYNILLILCSTISNRIYFIEILNV